MPFRISLEDLVYEGWTRSAKKNQTGGKGSGSALEYLVKKKKGM